MKKTLKKGLIMVLLIGMLGESLILSPTKAYADNNLEHTNGAEAAIITSIAAVGANVLHNLIRSTWNSYFKTGEPVWRSNRNDEDRRQRLLRYDTRGPDIIFREGFAPRNNRQNVYNFQWCLGQYLSGSYRDRDNPFVSTTRPIVDQDGEVIYRWEPDKFFRKEHMFLYEIFAPGGIDAEASLGTQNPYPEQDEITFPGGIRREFIRSVQELHYPLDSDVPELVRVVENPYFVGLEGLPEMEIPTGTKIEQWKDKDTKGEKRKIQPKEDTENEYDPMKQPGSRKPEPFKNDPNNPMRVADGNYQIRSILNTNKVVDISASEIGANVWIYQNYYLGNQNWVFIYNEEKKAYRIQTSFSNLVLARTDTNNVIGHLPSQAGNHGYWKLEENKDGTFIIRSYTDNDLVLDLEDADAENRTNIRAAKYTDTKNQKWQIDLPSPKPIGDDEYRISSRLDSEKAVGALSPGGEAFIDKNYGGFSQRWRLIYDDSKKAYRITPTSFYPDISLARDSATNQVLLRPTDTSNDNFYWQVERNLDGSFLIKNYANGELVLDLENSNTSEGTTVRVNAYTGEKNQKWWFEKPPTNTLQDGEYQVVTSLDFSKVATIPPKMLDDSLVSLSSNLRLVNQKWNLVYKSQDKSYAFKTLNPFLNQVMKRWDPDEGVYINQEDIGGFPHWRIEQTKDGYYTIRNEPQIDYVLDATNGADNTVVKLGVVQGIQSQKWDLQRTDVPVIPDGYYSVSTRMNHKKVLDTNKTEAMLFSYLALATQGWQFIYDTEKKAYKIYNEYIHNEGLVYQNENAKVLVDNMDGPIDADNEKRRYWTVEYNNAKGGYLIRSLFNPGQVLTLKDSNLNDGTPILTTPATFSENQIWNIPPKPQNGK